MKKNNYCIECNKILSHRRKNCRCWDCYVKYTQIPENNPNHIDGRSSKEYYCKCGKKIHSHTALYGGGKCISCATKGQNNGNFQHGERCNQHYCKICNEKISNRGAIYCHSCASKGENNGMFGKHFSEETKQLMHEKAILRYDGNPRNHPSYIENLDREYSLEFSNILKQQIRKRDNYICQYCKVKEENYYRKLDVHHIDYNKQNCNEENLITLCGLCNVKANTNRDYWYSFYTYKIQAMLFST